MAATCPLSVVAVVDATGVGEFDCEIVDSETPFVRNPEKVK